MSPRQNLTPQDAENHAESFCNIQNLTQEIDSFLHLKSQQKGFDLEAVGARIIRENSQFYSQGINIGGDEESSFSTLASEEENKNDLAKSFLATIFNSWLKEKKLQFRVAEIGAGSGDLMKEIFQIKRDALKSPETEPILKDFFSSLRFSIVDFGNMIEIQKKNLGNEGLEVTFLPQDISKNLIPSNSFDFVYGNEIPDTQRVDYLEVKTQKDGDKKYFIRAIKTLEGKQSEVLVSLPNDLSEKIGQEILPIKDLDGGLYLLQFGLHGLIHNIKQALKSNGDLMLVDYFSFEKNDITSSLSFSTGTGSSKEIEDELLKIKEPGEQIIFAKKAYLGDAIDITYSPAIGIDSCQKFDVKCSLFKEDDYRSLFVFSGEIEAENLKLLLQNSVLGESFSNSRMKLIIPMQSELSPTRSMSAIINDVELKHLPNPQLKSASGQMLRGEAEKDNDAVRVA